MKHIVEKISPSRVKIAVAVETGLWKEAQEKAFNKVSANVSVPGFRPGKAPKAMIKERVNPEAVFNEAIQNVLTPVYASLIEEEKLEPFYRPDVHVTKLSNEELELVYEVVLRPTVTLGAYKGLKVEREAPSVSESEVQTSIDNLLKGNAELVLAERPAKLGDTVTFDFEGFLPDENGALKPFDGGSAKNYSLELGSGQFIPGFEEELVGLSSEEKKKFRITFPENYVKELKGKEATFNVLIHEVKEKQIPELSDEAAADLGIADVKTVAELQEHQKKALLENKVRQSEEKFFNDIVAKIVEGSSFVIDEQIIASEAHNLEENLKKQIEQNGLTFEQYLEITGSKLEDLRARYIDDSKHNIERYMALGQIGHDEKLAVTDEDVDAQIKAMAEQYKMEEAQVRDILAKNLDQYKENLYNRKIRDFLLANNAPAKKAAEKPAAKETAKAESKKPSAKKPAAKKAPVKKTVK